MKKNQIRQGDVFIEFISKSDMPDLKTLKVQPMDNGRYILAYGEVTGHAHAICDNSAVEMFYEDPKTGTLYLKASEDLEVTHEEHSKVTVKEGYSKIWIQKEYSPEEIRNVAD